MQDNPFPAKGRWFRGILHTHTTASDGKWEPEQVVRWYADQGYDFVCLTDHGKVTRIEPEPGGPLLIPGEEIDFADPERRVGYHMVALDIADAISINRTARGQEGVDRIRQAGGEAILCHPYWSSQTVEDLRSIEGALGVEVFNTSCQVSIAKGLSSVHWDDALGRGKRWFGFAVDDSHWRRMDGAGGWVMVRAAELSRAAIMAALRAGAFYSSQGPVVEEITFTEPGRVRVRCSPARDVHFVARGSRGYCVHAGSEGPLLTEAEGEFRPDQGYLRIEVVDAAGRTAWTNPWFLE